MARNSDPRIPEQQPGMPLFAGLASPFSLPFTLFSGWPESPAGVVNPLETELCIAAVFSPFRSGGWFGQGGMISQESGQGWKLSPDN